MTSFLIRHFIPDYKNTKNPEVRTAYGKLCGWIGIFANLFLFIIKFMAGTISGSISITADAVNNLSDSASSIISLFGFKLSEKPADAEHPYGHGRYEYISALSVTAIIFVIGFELLKTSFSKIISPTPVEFSILSLSILILSILIKFWMYLFNVKTGKKINSKSLIATGEDSKNDCISTSSVLLSIIISFILKINLDGYVGLIVAIFILYSSFGMIKDILNTLLGNAPDEELVNNIHEKIMSFPGVLGTHDLIVHDYGPGRQFASVHVEVAAEEDILKSHDSIDNIEKYFLTCENLNLIVHMDPIVTKDEKVNNLRCWLSEKIKNISDELSIHDLRIVPGTTHTNIIFDCVVPPSFHLSHTEIKEKITELINQKYENHFAVITFENSFSPIPKEK